MATAEGRTTQTSTTNDAGDPSFARGAAGIEGGAHGNLSADEVRDVQNAEPEGSLEERRETQQVSRPTTDGVGEGLVKDQG